VTVRAAVESSGSLPEPVASAVLESSPVRAESSSEIRPTPPPEPQFLGRYAIYDQIASGGMATVHFGRFAGPSGFARTVAIKRAHPHLARESDFALMFLDEARLAARIRHPNVVATIDVLQTPTDLALVMEYVHGESLWKLARAAKDRGERVPVAVSAAIIIDTLHGLHAAHEATDEQSRPLGIVHRDVSPQNILVGVDGIARLVDFGIAKAAGRLHETKDSSVKGKYAYMAPEQARGEPLTRLADTFSAAIVFWELLTGERLFAGKSEAETIHKCLVARVRPPSQLAPDLDPALDAILAKGLSRDPAKRYPTAREMALAIEACVPAIRPSEVGAWVERMAGDALAARAEIQADIEGSQPSVREMAPTVPEGMMSDDRDAASAIRAAAEPMPARARRNALVVVAIAGALVITGAIGVALGRASPRAAADPPSTSALVAPLLSSMVVASASTAASSVAAVPPAASSASPSVGAHPASRAPQPLRSRPRSASCNPPYSIDSEGREIFKPECM
jgi:eukaryotic-like serine/threonine-protein kinase